MNRNIIFIAILLFFMLPSLAQNSHPQVWSLSQNGDTIIKYKTKNGGIPLVASANVIEMIYKRSNFSPMPTHGTITHFYIHIDSVTGTGLTIMGYRIKIGYSMLDTIPQYIANDTAMFPGTTTVFYDSAFIAPNNLKKGDWMKVALQNPFTYSFDPGEGGKIPNLVIHVSQDSNVLLPYPPYFKPGPYVSTWSPFVKNGNLVFNAMFGGAYYKPCTGLGQISALLYIGFDVQPLAGLTDPTAAVQLKIQPNPAKEIVTLQIEAKIPIEQGEISISNVTGMEIRRIPINRITRTVSKDIDISSLANGLYFVTLYTNGEKQVQKLVVQR
ncbi:MAG: T9SS type A sorting domain-containing protein [Bacteroidetes bacterium]|nr:T9SS type A sorting domain-containing protein [Bacteroidota bacterium]MBS1739358.1 T9SS type A sorting domain-containing protein [Bacteroidota bacterium]